MKKHVIICLILLITVSSFGADSENYEGQYRFIEVSEFSEEIITYPEKWNIDNKTVYTQGTWVIAGFLFSVRILFRGEPAEKERNYAAKIGYYALKNAYRNNAQLLNNYHDSYRISDKVAVTLLSCDENYNPDGKMFNYIFSISELLPSNESEGHQIFPSDLQEYALKIQEDILRSAAEKSSSYLKDKWLLSGMDKFETFSRAVLTVNDYIDSAEGILLISATYAGIRDGQSHYRLYYKIDFKGHKADVQDLYAVVEIAPGSDKFIYSVQFVIF